MYDLKKARFKIADKIPHAIAFNALTVGEKTEWGKKADNISPKTINVMDAGMKTRKIRLPKKEPGSI